MGPRPMTWNISARLLVDKPECPLVPHLQRAWSRPHLSLCICPWLSFSSFLSFPQLRQVLLSLLLCHWHPRRLLHSALPQKTSWWRSQILSNNVKRKQASLLDINDNPYQHVTSNNCITQLLVLCFPLFVFFLPLPPSLASSFIALASSSTTRSSLNLSSLLRFTLWAKSAA